MEELYVGRLLRRCVTMAVFMYNRKAKFNTEWSD